MQQIDIAPRQNTENSIRIAIAGHTNTGKTTLIRTLMRSSVGEVKDAANVTRVGAAYHYDGLQATFVDTPGFQHPLAVSMYLEAQEEDKNYKPSTKLEQKLNFDMDAIRSLEKSDIVIYVGSLSVVPDDSYKEEIEIVKKIQPKVIAILSQRRKQIDASGEAITNDRIYQWQEVLKEQKIEHVVVFDAHWDRPEKINEIYDSLSKTLSTRERKLLDRGIKIFNQRSDDICNESLSLLSECIESCQKQSSIFVKKGNYSEPEVRQKIVEELNKECLVFAIRVAELYKIAAEHPTDSKEELKIRLTESIDFGARMGSGTLVSSIFGGAGAVIGALIGAVLAGAISGGMGAGAGALAGAQTGGAIGAAIGGVGLLNDNEDNVKVQVSSEIIRDISASNLALIWGLSNIGFGRGSELSQTEIEEIKKEILDKELLLHDVDWTKLSKEEILIHCQQALDRLKSFDCN
jgi:uncharacterized membrane protein/guanylate kinase